ncbi:MAG: hypothetical protein O7I93_18685 [Gemmatimonadetes bacterium]|nr:hypothetical protein [Gemmatimonadota bacterium]
MNLTFRPFASPSDYEQGVELQRITWGQDFTECVPVSVLRISQKVGGVTAGAFDERDVLAGFVYGISGLRDGRPAHWSHMLAVRPEHRGTGIGTKMKALQRDLLLATNIEVAYWTYDPLVAGNANFNINLLGARPIEYVPDMYGSNTGSDLHSGLGTDRFTVQWDMADPAVERALAGRREPDGADDAPFAFDAQAPQTADGSEVLFPGAPTVRVPIPDDIQQVKLDAPDSALAWRRATRKALQWYMARGYRVTGLRRGPETERCYYVLSTERLAAS